MTTEAISANSNAISLDESALNGNKLCEIWPTVKEGLDLLSAVIKNPIVKFTISGIVAAGDAIIGKICQ